MTLSILLDRHGCIYSVGEVIKGAIIIASKGSMKHNGIQLQVEGSVALQLSPRKVGIFEALGGPVKPIQLMSLSIPLAEAGTFSDGSTTLPFEFPTRTKSPLYETYHGVFINVQYTISAELFRGIFGKNERQSMQFIIIHPGHLRPPPSMKPVRFTLEPHNLTNGKDHPLQRVPQFRIKGQIDSVTCDITRPLTGSICVEHSDTRISRIELQLVRVEFCSTANGVTKEATEVQNIQVVEGDVCRGLAVPLLMVFPRWFTCPTVVTTFFKIEFEVNLVVIFEDKHQLTDNFPIQLHRPATA
eukprot:EG_transcript_17635